eukprot:2962411-Prymnesium_polylepis.1
MSTRNRLGGREASPPRPVDLRRAGAARDAPSVLEVGDHACPTWGTQRPAAVMAACGGRLGRGGRQWHVGAVGATYSKRYPAPGCLWHEINIRLYCNPDKFRTIKQRALVRIGRPRLGLSPMERS